jgi:hypothetical protein
MSEFNITSWLKKQYINEAKLETPKSQALTKAINDAMDEIDSEMSYTDFAVAVANILKKDYGTYASKLFIDALNSELNINDDNDDQY